MMLLLQAGNAGIMNIVMLLGIMVVFYFFMIRPQQTKAKEQQAFINALKEGDKVVSAGGVHGKIVSVRDKTVVVEIDSAKGVRVVFEKTSISKDASAALNA
ncbi:MAG: preprotein translocase subunit YajC [Bacteroidota bacterium]